MDIENLLKSFNAHNVTYVIIGATAFPIYGYVRLTMDVDLFIEPTEENAQRAFLALQEFGYDLGDLTASDLLAKKTLIRQYAVETDIHPFVKGVTFQDVWDTRVEDFYKSTPTHFADLDQLIRMKKAAGRAKDKEDLHHLRKLKRIKKNSHPSLDSKKRQ